MIAPGRRSNFSDTHWAMRSGERVSVMIETYGTETRSPDLIAQWVAEKFDLRPGAIIENLDLRRPIYQKTAAYGHFGRSDPDFTWEATDIGREAGGRLAQSA